LVPVYFILFYLRTVTSIRRLQHVLCICRYGHSNTTDDSGDTWGVRLSLASFQREVTPPLFFSYTVVQDIQSKLLPKSHTIICGPPSCQRDHCLYNHMHHTTTTNADVFM